MTILTYSERFFDQNDEVTKKGQKKLHVDHTKAKKYAMVIKKRKHQLKETYAR